MKKTYTTFKHPLLILKLLGLYSRTKPTRVIIVSIFYSMLLIFAIVMAIITQFLSVNGNVFEFVTNMQAINGFLQILVKITLIARRQKELFEILDNTKKFWKTDVTSDEVRIKLHKLAVNSVHVQKIFLCSATVVALIVDMGGFAENHLPLGYWRIKDHDFLYKLAFISQFLAVPLASTLAAGLDCLFLAMSAEITIQFRILCHCLQKMSVLAIGSDISEQDYYNKIKQHIKYHTFLLRFSESLQNYFSIAMLIEYITISPLICAEMYITFESENVEQIIQHLIISITMILQISVYCFPAHVIYSESVAVSDAIYNSDWYTKNYFGVKTPITLIIQRSQKGFVFTAGGLIEVNLRTVLVVLKISWSACTAMRAVKGKH